MPKNVSEDFVFRYSLSELEANDDDSFQHNDNLAELFRLQVINILNVVELTCNGNPVKVDGYAFISDPDTVYDLFGAGR